MAYLTQRSFEISLSYISIGSRVFKAVLSSETYFISKQFKVSRRFAEEAAPGGYRELRPTRPTKYLAIICQQPCRCFHMEKPRRNDPTRTAALEDKSRLEDSILGQHFEP